MVMYSKLLILLVTDSFLRHTWAGYITTPCERPRSPSSSKLNVMQQLWYIFLVTPDGSLNSVVDIVTVLQCGWSGLWILAWPRVSPPSILSRPDPMPTVSCSVGDGLLFLGIKWLRHEVHCLGPFSVLPRLLKHRTILWLTMCFMAWIGTALPLPFS